MTGPESVVWVREDVVLAVHLRQLSEHGGGEGVRDEGLLRSALARPQNLLVYGDPRPTCPAWLPLMPTASRATTHSWTGTSVPR
jgi:hypothetical protein